MNLRVRKRGRDDRRQGEKGVYKITRMTVYLRERVHKESNYLNKDGIVAPSTWGHGKIDYWEF